MYNNSSAVEANFHLLYQWYLVSSRIAKIIPSYQAICFTGCTEEGTLKHVWWDCRVASHFWTRDYQLQYTVVGTPF